MQQKGKIDERKLPILLLLLIGVYFIATFGIQGQRQPTASSETNFVERSEHGLSIMPASCASPPIYYHNGMLASSDGRGFISSNGQTDYGASIGSPGSSIAVCVTNATGLSYFVPANTGEEFLAFKNLGTSIPGLNVR